MSMNWRDDSHNYYISIFSTNKKPYILSFSFSLIWSCDDFSKKYIWNFHYLFPSRCWIKYCNYWWKRPKGKYHRIFLWKPWRLIAKVTDLTEQVSVRNTSLDVKDTAIRENGSLNRQDTGKHALHEHYLLRELLSFRTLWA